MINILENDSNWEHVFAYASGKQKCPQPSESYTGSLATFDKEDVSRILGIHNGKKDSDKWRIAIELNDGRFSYIEAGCCYSGWG